MSSGDTKTLDTKALKGYRILIVEDVSALECPRFCSIDITYTMIPLI